MLFWRQGLIFWYAFNDQRTYLKVNVLLDLKTKNFLSFNRKLNFPNLEFETDLSTSYSISSSRSLKLKV